MPNDPNKNGRDGPSGTWGLIGAAIAAFIFSLFVIGFLLEPRAGQERVSYSAVKQMIQDGEVISAEFQEHSIVVVTKNPDETGATSFRAVIPVQGDPELLTLLEEHGIEISAEEPAGDSMFSDILPCGLLLGG